MFAGRGVGRLGPARIRGRRGAPRRLDGLERAKGLRFGGRSASGTEQVERRDDEQSALARGGEVARAGRFRRPRDVKDRRDLVHRLRRQPPGQGHATGAQLPETRSAVVRAREQPRAVGVDGQTADLDAGRVWERGRACGRKRPQLGRRGQLGRKLFGIVDGQPGPATPRTRREIEIEAALEPLVNEVGVAGNAPQRRMLGRHKAELAIFGLGFIPLAALFGGEEVLGRRVVGLGMRRRRQLGRRHVHRAGLARRVRIGPELVEPRAGRGRRLVRHDTPGADRPDNLHDLSRA